MESVSVQVKEKKALVELAGRIIFDNLMATQQALEEIAQSGVDEVYVRMDRLKYLDSSALGMLLNFNTTAQNAGVEVRMVDPPASIRAIFACTHLDQIFSILDAGQTEAMNQIFAAA